jgi:hypothetical protein
VSYLGFRLDDAPVVPIHVAKGEVFRAALEIETDEDISTWDLDLDVRTHVGGTDLVLELTQENGGIVVDASEKIVHLNITSEQTSALSHNVRRTYGLRVRRADDTAFLLMWGPFIVELWVARDENQA